MAVDNIYGRYIYQHKMGIVLCPGMDSFCYYGYTILQNRGQMDKFENLNMILSTGNYKKSFQTVVDIF
jgi:hypothetical protein